MYNTIIVHKLYSLKHFLHDSPKITTLNVFIHCYWIKISSITNGNIFKYTQFIERSVW